MHAARKLRLVFKSSSSISEFVTLTNMSAKELKRFVALSKQRESEILLSNMRLIFSIARSFQGKGLDFDDLVYEGIRGLRKAISKFDIEKGTAFSTYAYPWIKEYMRSALAASPPITLPRHVYKLAVKVGAIRNRFIQAQGYHPTDEELAEALGISMDRFDVVRRAMALVNRSSDSINVLIGGGDKKPNPTPYDESTWEKVPDSRLEASSATAYLVSREPQPAAAAGYNSIHQRMRNILRTLPSKEAAAIQRKFGITSEKELDGSAAEGVAQGDGKGTEEEDRALCRRGLRRLKKRMSDDPTFSEEFLSDAPASGTVLMDLDNSGIL